MLGPEVAGRVVGERDQLVESGAVEVPVGVEERAEGLVALDGAAALAVEVEERVDRQAAPVLVEGLGLGDDVLREAAVAGRTRAGWSEGDVAEPIEGLRQRLGVDVAGGR